MRRIAASPAAIVALAALPLLWPALWNGYPLVFADTGSYLTQVSHLYFGWDRPVFYGVFVFLLSWTVTTWPVIFGQCLMTAWVLHITQRALFARVAGWTLIPLTALLSLVSALPWFASQLMPDLWTGLLILLMALLILAPERLSRRERIAAFALAVFMVSAHQSHVLLACGILVFVPVRRWLGAGVPLGWRGAARVVGVPALAMLALASANLAGHGRFSVSPYGNVFLLARVLYDGPGLDAIERDCPRAGWTLCAYVGEFPEDSDAFLWRGTSPFYGIGGAHAASRQASAIVLAAVTEEPGKEFAAFARNTLRQLVMFRTGDGLEPWLTAVKPWIEADFPRWEVRTYLASRQTTGRLVVPAWLQMLHLAGVLAGVGASLFAIVRRGPRAGFCAVLLLALIGNAAITGGLSGPHGRYQSRVMWLPVMVLVFGLPERVRSRRVSAGPVLAPLP